MNKLIIVLFSLLLACNPSSRQLDINQATKELNTFIADFDSSPGWGSLKSGQDFSKSSFEREINNISDQLQLLQAIDTSQLSFEDRIDWKFAMSILAGRQLEEEQMKFWRKDPRQYMSFRRISNLINGPGEAREKLEELADRLELIPAQLTNGMKQLEVYVPRFVELGLFMAENGRTLFEHEIPEFLNKAGVQDTNLNNLNVIAAESLVSFIDYLKNQAPHLPSGDFAIGEEVYEALLKHRFLLPHSAESLWNYGLEQFRKTVEELETLASTIDPERTWQQLIIEIKNDYPHPDSMIQAHQFWVDRARDHILENDLLPIPWQERADVVPRAEYLRKTSYYGNFSRASKADEEGVFVARWMINPFEHQWDEDTKQQYLVEHDWGVIIVTAPHETYGGHHVQSLYQMHNPSKLRRENGISLFSEGWGLYNEHLMQETGFFPNDRIHLRQLQLRLWRNARVIYDVGLHTHRMTYEEAIQMMQNEVGFLRWAAQLEIDAATSRPGYFIGYFLGMTEILKMREHYKEKMGKDFSLKEFHVKLMEIGNMPTSLIKHSLFVNR